MGESVFMGRGLEKIKLLKSIHRIGTCAFENCDNLIGVEPKFEADIFQLILLRVVQN